MQIRRSLSAVVLALVSGVGGSVFAPDEGQAQEARAAYAYVTANLNQRAGPGTQFPPIVVIPARSEVLINGCLPNLAWCEGTYGETRGWMSAQYLRLYDYSRQAWVAVGDYARSTRLATFPFDLDRYWYAYYRDRPFYPQRAAWLQPPRSPGVDNGVFYRELSPYGRWVLLDGRYVWMPLVDRDWRPYTEGRWEYTQRYGWMWVSNEPFGWATYHYGRWAYSGRLGWVWVPGTQWAPAWVAWRGSEDHLAWAPLPPDAGPGFALDEGYDEIPGYYWQVVPAASFLQPNLADAILRDEGERRPSLERSRPIGNVTVVNNIVVNNVVNIDYVEEKTHERVVPREVVITNDAARQAEASGDVVRIYQPPVTEAPASETPPAVLPEAVAAGQSQTAGQAGDEPTTEDRVPEAAAEEQQLPATEAPPLAEDEAPPQVAEEQPAAEAPAPAAGEEPAPPPAEPPATPSTEPAPPAEQPAPPPPTEAPPPAADQPAAPPAVVEPPVGDEAPPPPTEEPPPPPAADQPPAPAEETPPPPPPEEPAPQAEQPAPPPAAEEPPPPAPPAAEPPSAPAEEPAPPPPVEEASPPPLPPPAAEPPPAPAEEPAPPPPVEEPPPLPAADQPPPPAADQPPPPPAAEQPPAAEEPQVAAPEAQPQGQDCPEGMRMNKKGNCVARDDQGD